MRSLLSIMKVQCRWHRMAPSHSFTVGITLICWAWNSIPGFKMFQRDEKHRFPVRFQPRAFRLSFCSGHGACRSKSELTGCTAVCLQAMVVEMARDVVVK
jgi:hypothetical protein